MSSKYNVRKFSIVISLLLLSSCFASSLTTEEILNEIAYYLHDYKKIHGTYPEKLDDLKGFPYELKIKQDSLNSYIIHYMEGYILKKKQGLVIRYSNFSDDNRKEIIKSLRLSHNNTSCEFLFRKDGTWEDFCRPTQPGGFRQ